MANPALKSAARVVRAVAGGEPSRRERQVVGSVLHYAFGISMGAVCGAAAELSPKFTAAAGTFFGAAVWLVADEIATSAAGVAEPPTKYPPRTHLFALVVHLAFGAVTESLRRLLRS
jgi:putative membrane protein